MLLTLLALAIRFWQAGYHSLWFDEAMSVFWARHPAREIIDVGLYLVKDKHPPVYYLLLHLWTGLFGDGTVAVRGLSIMFGAALPPLLALVGSELGDRRAGLFAGLLATFNPMLVWYSQEARMFLPATTIGVLATWCLLKALKQEEWLWWIGFVFCSLAGFYSYLFYVFVIVFQSIFALVWVILEARKHQRRIWESLPRVVVMLAVLALLCAPLALQAYRVSTTESPGGQPFEHAFSTMWSLLKVYTIRRVSWPSLVVAGVGLIGAILLLSGLVAGPVRMRLLLWCWLGIPMLAGNVMLGVNEDVFSETRYFLFLVPAICLAWGSALVWLSRRIRGVGWIALAVWTLVALLALPANWTTENRREDWRSAAEYVMAHAGPNDATLLHPAFVHVAFEYYDQSGLPIFFPFQGDVESHEQIDPPLRGLTGYTVVWLITSHDAEPDPGHLVQRWFEEQFPLVTEQFPTGIGVRGYAINYRSAELPTSVPAADISYAEGLRLKGYTIDQTTLPATDEQYHPPSNWIHTTLYWQIDQPLEADVSIGLKMVDEWGQVWGDRLYRANDVLTRYPSSRWSVGEIIRTDFDVNLNPVTPAGDYRLELTLFDSAGQPWPLMASAPDNIQIDLSPIRIVEK